MSIIDYIPEGQSNAISRRALCAATGLPDRMMRKEIEHARKEHAILNSQDGQGYFLPLPEERPLVLRWVRQERSRSQSVYDSTTGAEKWLAGDSGANLIKVHSYVRRRKKNGSQIEGQVTL